MAKAIPSFSLSYASFGSQGTSSNIILRVSNSADGFSVTDEIDDTYIDDDTDEDLADKADTLFTRTTTFQQHHGWRDIVAYLANQEIVAFGTDGNMDGEYPWPGSMDLTGDECLATDMVALAWAGPPITRIAQALALHDDDTLLALRHKHGSLRSRDFVDELLRINKWCDELLVDMDDVLVRAHFFKFDFREIRRDVVRLARVERAEEQATKLRKEWSLAPFRAGIDSIMTAWRKRHPNTSTNTAMGNSMRAGAILRSLEAYAIEKQTLPDGTITVDEQPRLIAFSVNIGELRPERKPDPTP